VFAQFSADPGDAIALRQGGGGATSKSIHCGLAGSLLGSYFARQNDNPAGTFQLIHCCSRGWEGRLGKPGGKGGGGVTLSLDLHFVPCSRMRLTDK